MEQEGFNLAVKANFSELIKANKAVEDFEAKIKGVQSSLSSIKMPNSILNGIQSLDKETQAYLKRLESQARLYAEDGQSAKAYESSLHALKVKTEGYKETIDKLSKDLKDERDDLERLGKTQGANSKAYQEQKSKIDNTVTSLNNYKIALRQTESQLKNMPDSSFHKTRLEVEQNVSAIKRLEAETKLYTAEGNKVKANATAWEANKLRVQEYQRELKRTQSEESKLSAELSKLDRSSEAYTRTKTKINEVKTKEAELNTEIKKTQEEMNSLHPSAFDRIKSKLSSTRDDAKNTHGVFKSMFGANLAANFVTNGLGRVKDGFSSLLGSAKEYAMNQQTMNATWLTLTGNADKGKQMVNQVNDMAAAAQNSTEMVDNLSQKFYAINGSAKQTGEITKSVLTLQDAFGATDDAVENFGTQFSQMMANGKVSAQDMMSFVNTFPKLRTQLLETMRTQTGNHKLTMKQMNDMMSAGKISSQTMIETLENTAKKYKGATENFSQTIPGMVRTVKSQMPRLMQAFETPITQMKNPLMKQISDWSTSKGTQTEFTKLGKTVSTGINGVLSKLGGGKKLDIGDSINAAIDKVNSALKKLFSFAEGHAKDFETIGKGLFTISSTIGKSVWKDFAGIAVNIGKAFGLISKNNTGGTIHALAEGVDNLSKNRLAMKLIADSIVTVATVKGLKSVGGNLFDIGSSIVGVGKKAWEAVRGVDALIKGLRGVSTAENVSDDIQLLNKGGKGVRKLFGYGDKVSDVVDTASDVADVATGGKGGLLKKIFRRGGTKAAEDVVEEGASLATKVPKKWYEAPLETLRHANKTAGTTGLKAGWGNLSTLGKVAHVASIGGIVLDAGSDLFSAFQHRNNATQRSKDIGGATGAALGGALGMFLGPLGSMVAGYAGEKAGQWAGGAADSITKGVQSYSNGKKAPKNKASLENVGWSANDTFSKMNKWGNQQEKNFDKWADASIKGTQKNFSNFGKGAAKMWDGAKRNTSNFFKSIPKNFDNAKRNVGKFAQNLGTNIRGGWNKAATASHNFFKNLPKNFSNAKKTVSKWASDTGKNIKNGWNGAKKNVGNFFSSLPKNISKAKSNVNKWVNNTDRSIKKGWDNSKKNVGNFFKSIPGKISDTKKHINTWASDTGKNIKKGWENGKKGVTKFVTDLPSNLGKAKNHTDKWIDDVGKGIQSGWNSFSKGFAKGWNSFWGGLGDNLKSFFSSVKSKWDGFKSGLGKVNKNIQNAEVDVANEVSYWTGGSRNKYKKAHANGGAIPQGHTALVGEEGPELAYKPYANQVRLLGENGPAFEKVHSGERILNARDTQKVIRGGLGRGTILKGYANGTTSLKDNKTQAQSLPQAPKLNLKVTGISSARKSANKDFKNITDNAKKETKKLNSNTNKDFKEITKDAKKQTHSLYRNSVDDFKTTTDKVGKETDKIRENSEKDYTNMRKSVEKQMDYLHDGVIDSAESTSKGFSKALDKMSDGAQDAMKDTIGQLNAGISSIDKVLSQFGGNSQVIKPVHFATGTDANGRLTQNTLAMVNDATTGPRQEALISDTNEIYYPQGDNITMMLPAGWGVLNGEQTQRVQEAQQDVQHFAKGSGVDVDKLIKIAEAGQKDPAKDFKNSFLSNIKPKGPVLKQGVISMAGNGSNQYGVPWNSAMWSVINDAIGGGEGQGGTREEFLKYAEKTFSGVPYAMGAMSKAATDCSGMVAQALQHFGINIGRTTVAMQESSGVQSLGHNLSRTLPGDIVVFGHGTGAAGHVGIIADPKKGTMFNANGGYGKALISSIDEAKSMGYEYFRVKGLHNATDTKKEKATAPNKQLKALAKRQLGSKAIKWIEDNLGDALGSAGSFGLSGDAAQRIRQLAKGLKRAYPAATKNGMAAIIGNALFESQLNPGIQNSIGASGLWQWLGGRFSSLQSYAASKGKSWKNAGVQIDFALNGDDAQDRATFKRILGGSGSAVSLASEFSSQWERGGFDAQHANGAREAAAVLKGFAKGGKVASRTPFIAGEQGPELITADGPVKVDTHEETKRKLSDVSSIVDKSKHVINEEDITKRTGVGSVLKNVVGSLKSIPKPNKSINPTINININGPISSTKDAQNVSKLVKGEIVKVFEQLGDAFGYEIG